MLYYALTIKDGFVTGVHESGTPFTSQTFANSPEYAGQEVRQLEEKFEYETGQPLASYNEDGTLRPLIDRINEGLAEVPDGHAIIDGELVAEEHTPETEQQADITTSTLLNILLGGAL